MWVVRRPPSRLGEIDDPLFVAIQCRLLRQQVAVAAARLTQLRAEGRSVPSRSASLNSRSGRSAGTQTPAPEAEFSRGCQSAASVAARIGLPELK